MKNNLVLLISAIFLSTILSGCFTQEALALKGNYVDKPIEIISDKPYDQVWSNIIDLFAQKGLSIKVIDKSSGLIVSERASFDNNYTFEENGKLKNPNAYLVLNTVKMAGSKMVPASVTAEWNVRIKTRENKTVINVNITNISGHRHYDASQYSPAINVNFEGKSTGVFENEIAEMVK